MSLPPDPTPLFGARPRPPTFDLRPPTGAGEPLASLLLVAMPGAPSVASLFLVVWPGDPFAALLLLAGHGACGPWEDHLAGHPAATERGGHGGGGHYPADRRLYGGTGWATDHLHRALAAVAALASESPPHKAGGMFLFLDGSVLAKPSCATSEGFEPRQFERPTLSAFYDF